MTHGPNLKQYTRANAGKPFGKNNSCVKFVDGSTFEGSFDDDGRFSGNGRFQWSFGLVVEGVFAHGELLPQTVSTESTGHFEDNQVAKDASVHVSS